MKFNSETGEVRFATGQLSLLVTLAIALVSAVVYQTTTTVANSTRIEAHEKRIDKLEGTVFPGIGASVAVEKQ